jgi:hypothetical protein
LACHQIQILVRPNYGTTALFVSNLYAFPNNLAEDGDFFREILKVDVSLSSYGQAAVHLCPNTHKYFMPGTWAFSVEGKTPTEFYVEVVVSDTPHPLPPPPLRLSCDDVPEEEWAIAQGNNTDDIVLCVEDGISQNLNFPGTWQSSRRFAGIILPVPAGCHGISVMLNVNTFGRRAEHEAHLYCLSKTPGERISGRDQTFLARFVAVVCCLGVGRRRKRV